MFHLPYWYLTRLDIEQIVLWCLEFLRHVMRSVCIFADIHNSSTVHVLPATVFAALRPALHLHGRYAVSLVLFHIFEHLHTSTVMYYKNSASLRLHASNAASTSVVHRNTM